METISYFTVNIVPTTCDGQPEESLIETLDANDIHYVTWSWSDIIAEVGDTFSTYSFSLLSPCDQLQLFTATIAYLEGDLTLTTQVKNFNMSKLRDHIDEHPDKDLVFTLFEGGAIVAIYSHQSTSQAMAKLYNVIYGQEFKLLPPDEGTASDYVTIFDCDLFTL